MISGGFGAWLSAVRAVAGSGKPPEAKGWEMITGSQIRAARELLGWRQAELAKRARIQAHSVESAESSLGQSFVPGQDMQAMRAVLEAAGVEFTNGDEPGVKLRRPGPQGGLGP